MMKWTIPFLFLATLIQLPTFAAERWYTEEQVQKGKKVFQDNCASCHGQNAEATPNWKETDANGKYPPPPLNGTAHAWHHDLKVLRRTIREGGIKLGGVMPPFADKLNSGQIDEAIAFFQSQWPGDIYDKWAKRFEEKEQEIPSLSGVADTKKEDVTKWLRQRIGQAKLGELKETALEGVWQTKLDNRYIYLIEDGEFAFIGDFWDLKKGSNLTEADRRVSIVETLAEYQASDRVTYSAKGEEKARLTVFTDTSCPYCRKLHEELPELQDAGITVSYLPFPRGGQRGPGYSTLKSVWCAEDRQQAMDDAKNELTEDLPEGNCPQAAVVDKAYLSGNQIGITGTPALVKPNGELITGYVPFAQLIPMLTGNRGSK